MILVAGVRVATLQAPPLCSACCVFLYLMSILGVHKGVGIFQQNNRYQQIRDEQIKGSAKNPNTGELEKNKRDDN